MNLGGVSEECYNLTRANIVSTSHGLRVEFLGFPIVLDDNWNDTYYGNLRYPPQSYPPNKEGLIRALFLGGGGTLGSHEHRHPNNAETQKIRMDTQNSPIKHQTSNLMRYIHHKFQVPKMEGFLNLIRISFGGVGFPLHKPYPYSLYR